MRSRRARRGQALLEFALVLPIFLVFLAAVLDLGRVFYANISLTNAAREGAFQASQTPDLYDDGQPCNTATNLVVCRIQLEAKGSSVTIDPADIDMSCSKPGCPAQAGSMVTIEVGGTFQLVTPLLSAIFGGQTVDLHSSATAQVEYLPNTGTVTPPPAPVADFTTSGPRSGLPPLTVAFVDRSTGDVTGWNWDFGDGGTATSQSPTHIYTLPGTYTVTLTVVNLTGDDSEVKTGYITVDLPLPTPTPTGTTTPTPVPTASCSNPPNVIGQTPWSAQADLINAGFAVLSYSDLTNGPKNKVQAQNPDHTQCLAPGSVISIHWRLP